MKTLLKNFKVSFRLQHTANQTHPIQVLLNLATKEGDKYLRIIYPVGVSLKKSEWNVQKSKSTDHELNSRLFKLESGIYNEILYLRSLPDADIIKEYHSGKFKTIVQSQVNIVIHEQPQEDMMEQSKRLREMILSKTPQNILFHSLDNTKGEDYFYNKAKENELQLKDKYGNITALEEFFETGKVMEYQKPSQLIMEENLLEIEEDEIIPFEKNPVKFYEYIIHVGKEKVRRGDLTTTSIYDTLSKYFERYNKKLTLYYFTDKVAIDFFNWLRPQLKTMNTFGKYKQFTKSVLNYAVIEEEKKLKVDTRKSIYTVNREEVIQPFLNDDQLEALLKLEFTPEESKLELVRDLAVVSSYTGGIRYGNWKQFFHIQTTTVNGKPVNFIESMSTKVGERKRIPVLPFVVEILQKYKTIPKINEADFNKNIKLICERAGAIEPTFTEEYIYYRKDLQTKEPIIVKIQPQGEHEPRIPRLCDLVASHTMRRSFATNFYNGRTKDGKVLRKPVSASVLREFLGHHDEEQTMSYVKSNSKQKFDSFAEDNILNQ